MFNWRFHVEFEDLPVIELLCPGSMKENKQKTHSLHTYTQLIRGWVHNQTQERVEIQPGCVQGYMLGSELKKTKQRIMFKFETFVAKLALTS